MKVFMLNPPAAGGIQVVREGRCMQRKGAWTAVWAPLSLAITASVLIDRGHEVILHDCIVEEIGFDELRHIIREFQPDYVVFNATTPSLESDLSVSRIIHEENPEAVAAAIGIHGTALPTEILELEPALDAVIRGEPEITAAELAQAITDKKGFDGIDGISYRSETGIIHNDDRKPLSNLDKLPFPAWHLVQRDRYIMPFKNRQFLLVATSRGCPYPCKFCADAAYYGKRLRVRSPGMIVDEMEWVYREFGISDFLFWSESFTLKPEFARQVAEEILKRSVKFKWVCNSRVDHVNLELLQLFKKAGCWMIGYGIESGSQKTLDSIKKGTTLEQAENAVAWARKAGLEVTGHCVIGYPGETESDILDTVRFTKKLKLDFAQFYCAVPFPGSELYRMAVSNDWFTTRDWTMFEQNFSVLDYPGLNAEKIMELRARAYRSFYLSPRVILRTLKRIRTWNNLKYFMKMVFDFVTWI